MNTVPLRAFRRTLLLAIAIAASAAQASAPLSSQSSRSIVRAARWLDPVSGVLHGPVAVEIADGRIVAIAASDVTAAPSVSVRDLGDVTLLPGLVDAHVHLGIGGRPDANAMADLRAGFTTVVDLGARTDAILRLRDRINRGEIDGPRILAAGKWIGKQGGICEFGGIGVAGGADAYRARVRENVDAGADLIKVCVSTWVADAFNTPEAYEIENAALAAAVEESHRSKHLAIAHAISLGSVKAALAARVDGLAHAAYVDRPTATLLRERGVFMIPTLASLAGDGVDPPSVALRAAVETAHRAGVRLVFGTDGGVLPHGENAKEFAALAKAGVPPLDAIRAATINAADAFGLGREIGQIKAGYAADLVAAGGNPLQDPEALSRISFVMRGGRIVR
jgi:imidazolonepropionase-like amidohydrolase